MTSTGMFITAQRSADQLNLTLLGEWRATLSEAIEAELAAIDFGGARSARLHAGSSRLDLSGAWLLHDFLARVREAGLDPRFEGAVPSALTLVERTYSGEIPARVDESEWLSPERAVQGIGRRAVRSWQGLLAALELAGRVCIALMRAFGSLHRLRHRRGRLHHGDLAGHAADRCEYRPASRRSGHAVAA